MGKYLRMKKMIYGCIKRTGQVGSIYQRITADKGKLIKKGGDARGC